MAKKRKKGSDEAATSKRRGGSAFWSGTVSFGLVNVPVDLFPANRRAGVSFRLLDEDGTPLERRYYCPRHERDVHREHILRGYAVEGDEYVIVRDDELEAIEPKKTREIDLRRFVDLAQISPMFFDRAYFLTPSGDSNKAYRLLADVMEKSGRAGIATFVMRDREYLIAILAENGILRAETLRFHDELRSPDTIGLVEHEEADHSEARRLERLIEHHTAKQLHTDWLQDQYAQRVRKLVQKKRKNPRNVVRVERETDHWDADEAPEFDLLEKIRRSLRRKDGAASNDRTAAADDLQQQSKEEL
jgi:DNA end-binding protein Ku